MYKMSSQNTRRQHRLNELMESLIHGDVYVRFGGEFLETYHREKWQGAGCLAYANSHRGIDPNTLALLGTGSYVDKGESILITGTAGVGKSYLTTALGNKACNQGYKVNYFNMQKLLGKLRLARVDGTIVKLITKISKVDLLIIDDFGMEALEGQQQNDFMEIIEDRHGRKATIITSQLPVSKWYDVIGNEVIADAVLDRIVHSSHRFDLKGESLRKKL